MATFVSGSSSATSALPAASASATVSIAALAASSSSPRQQLHLIVSKICENFFQGIPKTFQASKVSFPQPPLSLSLSLVPFHGAFLPIPLISLNMSATCCFHVILHCQAQLCAPSGCVCVCVRTARPHIYVSVLVCVCVSVCLCFHLSLCQMHDDFPACDFYICISSTLMTIYHGYNRITNNNNKGNTTTSTTRDNNESNFSFCYYWLHEKSFGFPRLLLWQPQLCLPQKFLRLLSCFPASSARCCCCLSFFHKNRKSDNKEFVFSLNKYYSSNSDSNSNSSNILS